MLSKTVKFRSQGEKTLFPAAFFFFLSCGFYVTYGIWGYSGLLNETYFKLSRHSILSDRDFLVVFNYKLIEFHLTFRSKTFNSLLNNFCSKSFHFIFLFFFNIQQKCSLYWDWNVVNNQFNVLCFQAYIVPFNIGIYFETGLE